MLDVRRLRLLRELSLRGTLAEVADALHQSPSSVSQQLSVLEREVGVTLLRKVGRGVELTAAATLLADYTGEVIELLERAESQVAAMSEEVTGTVRVAAFQSAAVAFVPQLLADLAELHPLLRVTLAQRAPEEALDSASARELDLVVAEQYPGHATPWYAGLDRVPLTTDALRLAVPPGWEAIGSIGDAAGLPWVMEPAGAASRHWAEQVCRTAGFEPDVRYQTDDLQTHIALIEEGHAVAILPDLMSARRKPLVRSVGLPGSPRRTVFTATRSSLAATPAITAVRACLVRVVADLAGSQPA